MTGTTAAYSLADAMCPPKASSSSSSSSGTRDRRLVHDEYVDRNRDDPAIDPNVQLALDRARHLAAESSSLVRRTASLRLALRASINIADDVLRRHAKLLLHSGERNERA